MTIDIAVNQQASAGLTTATTAYSADDQLGTILEFTNAVPGSGGTGAIHSATLLDKAKVTGVVDLYLFDQSVTIAADNAAASISDADMLNCLGMIRFPQGYDLAANRFATVADVAINIECAVTSLFGVLVTRSAHTFFGAVDDLVVTLGILEDAA